MAKPRMSSTQKKRLEMKKLKTEKKEIQEKITKRKVDIQTAEIANRNDERKIKEIEQNMFKLDEFFDMPKGPNDWSLYSEKTNVTETARKLSKKFRELLRWLRKADNKREAFSELVLQMEDFMEKYASYGASDTEPREIMHDYAERYAKRLGYDVRSAW